MRAFLTLLCLCILPVFGAAEQGTLTAQDFVDRANHLLRGDTSHAKVTMTVERPEWKRSLEIESWNRGRDRAMILVHSPAKDKGTATLRLGHEMWLWMPRVERVIKVPPTMMHSAWMGSNFTYEDIVKSDSLLRDYTHKIISRKEDGDHELVQVEAMPKADAPVVWGKVVLTGLAYAPSERFPDGYVIPTKEEDYSERGELIRTLHMSDIGMLGGKLVPRRLECVPEKKQGERTIVKYNEIEFDLKIPDSTFSLEKLQKAR